MRQRPKLLLLPLLTLTLVAGWLMNSSSARAATASNVIYHGGPVMAGNMKAYAIFWEPSGSFVSSTYNELLQRYFGDIGESGLYANNRQYTDTKDRAPEDAKLAGAFVDTSPYPSTPFLQDSDIRHEITHAMSVKGWKPGITHAFFVYTALNEFICSPFGFCSAPNSSTPLGWCGWWWLPPAHRLGQSAQAQGTRAGPTGEQQLQLAHYRKGGQADARTFGSSRCSVTKAWATDTRVT
jgi:hypothetical protein